MDGWMDGWMEGGREGGRDVLTHFGQKRRVISREGFDFRRGILSNSPPPTSLGPCAHV